ncbi:protein from bacterioferritin family [Lachnospiraceae bacterium KM106-2]|nr:protein from bacterioferritin family [Lachnospiraceae bacterium KM106-2]
MDFDLTDLDGYIDNAPYDEIKVISPNMYYGELIMNDYSGIEGKLTQYLQYRFHYYTAKQNKPKIAVYMKKLAKVKEIHMEMFAELLFVLGTVPAYRVGLVSGNDKWDSTNVTYGKTLKDQLEADLELGYRTIRNYNAHIKLISDPFIKKFLERILADEELHIKWLEYMIKEETN